MRYSPLLLTLVLASCGTLPPRLTGISYLGPAATTEILAASRAKLRSMAPAAYIFRVHIDGYLVQRHGETANVIQAWVYYRTGSGPARHLVVEEVHGHWRVVDAPQAIDYELPEDIIITGALSWPGLTRRCSQPLAVPMTSFQMTLTLNSAVKLASASGG